MRAGHGYRSATIDIDLKGTSVDGEIATKIQRTDCAGRTGVHRAAADGIARERTAAGQRSAGGQVRNATHASVHSDCGTVGDGGIAAD